MEFRFFFLKKKKKAWPEKKNELENVFGVVNQIVDEKKKKKKRESKTVIYEEIEKKNLRGAF